MSIFNDKSLKGVADAVSKIMEASKKEENKFHNKLDKLVHGTFGDSPDEKKMKKEETEKHPFVAVHAKKGMHQTHGSTSYEAAQNAAKHWKMKNTAGIDVYRADKKHVAEEKQSCEDEAEEAVDKHEKKMHGKKGEVAKHEKEMHKEEVEQIDELSKDTLTSYRDKANVSQGNAYDAKMKAGRSGDYDTAHKHNAVQTKRGIGLGRVANRGIKPFGPMTKEEFSFTSLIESYKKDGLKSLSKMKKEEVDNETYEKEMKDQKDKFDGKKKGADVAKASVQAVKQEEMEQIDEISLAKASKAYAGRWLQSWGPDAKEDKPGKKDSVDKMLDTGDRIVKKFGKKGSTRVERLNWSLGTRHPEQGPDGLTDHGPYFRKEDVEQIDEDFIRYSSKSDSYFGKYKNKKFNVPAPQQSHELTSTHVSKHSEHTGESAKNLAKHLRHYYRNVNHSNTYKINEEVELDEEQLDELKKSTLASYIGKAAHKSAVVSNVFGSKANIKSFNTKVSPMNKYQYQQKRLDGIQKAASKLAKEEVELDEGILSTLMKASGTTPKDVANSTISAFNKKAPGTKMHNHPNFSKFKQEVHAHISSAKSADEAMKRTSDDHVKSLAKKHFSEEVELEERALTEPETKKKEEVVKSMKKKLSGFKDRYGERGKSVLYATATKIAKEKA